MTKALISIDYTVDFVADDGKLTAGAPAQAISKTIAQVTKVAFDRGDYIFLPLMPMMKGIFFTQRVNSFHHITSKALVDVTFMDRWRIFIRSIKQILASFGWINGIIQLFRGQIWIFACEKEK